jgi:hypothetical protein
MLKLQIDGRAPPDRPSSRARAGVPVASAST